MSAGLVPLPDFRILLDGQDLTARMKPRLIDLSLTEKRGGEADELTIGLSDHDGALAIPKTGAMLSVQLGWARGAGLALGLVDKGRFRVGAVEHGGPPDTLTIRARAADLGGDLRTRREGNWRDTTLGAVITGVAGRNGLTPRIADELAAIAVASLIQSRESDLALLRRLGREHDAVATIKAGALIFARVGSGLTATGKTIPPAALVRQQGDRHRYSVEEQDETTGVEAGWHDLKTGRKKRVLAGKKGKVHHLSRTYSGEAAARAAAKAEHSRRTRLPVKLSFDLALGRPDLYPERTLTVSGFKPEIDAATWLIAQVTHHLGNGGFTTALEMEGV